MRTLLHLRGLALVATALFAVSGCSSSSKNGDDKESDAGSPCDDGDCAQCEVCAAKQACAAELDACQSSSACVAIDECIGFCGADVSCKNACVVNNSQGASRYAAVRACIYCETCPDSCAGFESCD